MNRRIIVGALALAALLAGAAGTAVTAVGEPQKTLACGDTPGFCPNPPDPTPNPQPRNHSRLIPPGRAYY